MNPFRIIYLIGLIVLVLLLIVVTVLLALNPTTRDLQQIFVGLLVMVAMELYLFICINSLFKKIENEIFPSSLMQPYVVNYQPPPPQTYYEQQCPYNPNFGPIFLKS